MKSILYCPACRVEIWRTPDYADPLADDSDEQERACVAHFVARHPVRLRLWRRFGWPMTLRGFRRRARIGVTGWALWALWGIYAAGYVGFWRTSVLFGSIMTATWPLIAAGLLVRRWYAGRGEPFLAFLVPRVELNERARYCDRRGDYCDRWQGNLRCDDCRIEW